MRNSYPPLVCKGCVNYKDCFPYCKPNCPYTEDDDDFIVIGEDNRKEEEDKDGDS